MMDEMEKWLKEKIEVKDDEFQCSECCGIFEKSNDWSEKERWEEYGTNFSEVAETNVPFAVVCDDCYNDIMDKYNIENKYKKNE